MLEFVTFAAAEVAERLYDIERPVVLVTAVTPVTKFAAVVVIVTYPAEVPIAGAVRRTCSVTLEGMAILNFPVILRPAVAV